MQEKLLVADKLTNQIKKQSGSKLKKAENTISSKIKTNS